MTSPGRTLTILGLAALALRAPRTAVAQEMRIADLTIEAQAVPVRLVGYGLVVGLANTGDRGTSVRHGGGMTVQSVANLLRRFDLEVPPEAMRTRNAAAVLVTAEVNPYMRAGARFNVHVSSIGDANSLRGGVLWMTPLQADPDGPVLATAQGAVLLTDDGDGRRYRVVGQGTNTARIPEGGVVEGALPRPTFADVARLDLRSPDIGTASRIAAAVNAAIGAGTATVEDPGAVALTITGDAAARADVLARVRDLRVTPSRRAVLVVDARAGTIVAGGDVPVGDATVSHEDITLSVGGPPTPAPANPGAPQPAGSANGAAPSPVRVATGTQAVRVAEALRVIGASPRAVASIFLALREAGALAADVEIR